MDPTVIDSGLHRRAAAAAAWLVLGVAGPAGAQGAPPADTPPMLEITLGAFGVLNGLSDGYRFGLEYRWRPLGPWAIAPGTGAVIAENGANFVFGDLHRDFSLGRDWWLTPSFGAGLFHDGHGLHLGDELEFQSGLELTRTFRNGLRLGIAGYHLSNGGLGHTNPGTEVAVLLICVPLAAAAAAADDDGAGR